VLTTFLNEDVYNYNNKEDEIMERLLLLENVDFSLSQQGKLVTSIKKHHEMQSYLSDDNTNGSTSNSVDNHFTESQ